MSAGERPHRWILPSWPLACVLQAGATLRDRHSAQRTVLAPRYSTAVLGTNPSSLLMWTMLHRLRGWRRLLAAAWLNCTLHEEGGCDLRLVQREKGDDSPVRTCTERNETVKQTNRGGAGAVARVRVL